MAVDYKLDDAFYGWLWKYHNDVYCLVVLFGHVELVKYFKEEYLAWSETEEAESLKEVAYERKAF